MSLSPAHRYARFAWATVGFNLLVIVWGAFVRATGSGAGCGKHWPLCDGEVTPPLESTAQLIEFTHRLTSGVALLAVLARNGPTGAWDTDTLKRLLQGRSLTGVLGRLAEGHDLNLDELQRLSQNWSRMRARIRDQVQAHGLPAVAIPLQERVGDTSVWRLDDKLVIQDVDG